MWQRSLSALAVACLAGCGAAQGAEPIKIGAVLPFSGGVELYGAQAKLGVDLAAADINAAGGILGRPVEIVYRDDGTRPNIAAAPARRCTPRAAPGRTSPRRRRARWLKSIVCWRWSARSRRRTSTPLCRCWP